jgi:predicted HAD superfamily Cof-like phosphohydrolase
MRFMELEEPVPLGQHPSAEVRLSRLRYIQEELAELAEAMHEELPVEEVADALGDILYVTIGTFLDYSIPVMPVWDEIQRSNMTKSPHVRVGKKKGGKGENFEPPRLRDVLCLRTNSKEK